ncbi:hypothetical protein A6R70_01420 [Agrobacterium rubi]|jgi:hypothetical protein|nr:hypothetical protein [Agrobacterium rubi]
MVIVLSHSGCLITALLRWPNAARLVLIPAGMYHTQLWQASDHGKSVGAQEKLKEVLDIALNGM